MSAFLGCGRPPISFFYNPNCHESTSESTSTWPSCSGPYAMTGGCLQSSMPRGWGAGSRPLGECRCLQTADDDFIANGSSVRMGSKRLFAQTYTLDRPVGGEQPRCERESCSWKPNCGLPSTPIRGWTVKGRGVPPPTLVGGSTVYRHRIVGR